MSDLYKKHFLKLLDFTPAQFTSLLTLPHSSKPIKKGQGSTKAYR
jgi:ornithine carbamoyltransferase